MGNPKRRRLPSRRAVLRLTVFTLAAGAGLAGGCAGPDPAGSVVAKGSLPSYMEPSDRQVVEGNEQPDFWDRLNFARPPKAPAPPAETIVLRPDGVVAQPPPKPGSPEELLAGAHELFRQGDYVKAEALFKYVADKKRTPMAVAEEARYYQAESLRLERKLAKAADVYADLLNKFPNSAYREQATRHMFDIADFWLEDTRAEMEQTKEKNEGKRWFVPSHFVHNPFDGEKPFLDEEGRAIEKLEQVRYNDINGPLADQALFLAGSVKFFNGDYKEADNYFSQIHEKHPNSPLAQKAVELAIVSKHLSTGGADYDGRKVAEARKLVQSAFDNYPELANKKRDFLERQLGGITLQQAEKDYRMAEFWKRTGHIGSAYFYFEMVQRRYPNTKFAAMAKDQVELLKAKAAKDKNVITPPPAKALLGQPARVGEETAPRPRPDGPPVEEAPAPRPVPAVPPPAPRFLPSGVQ